MTVTRGEGFKKSENFADVLFESPLTIIDLALYPGSTASALTLLLFLTSQAHVPVGAPGMVGDRAADAALQRPLGGAPAAAGQAAALARGRHSPLQGQILPGTRMVLHAGFEVKADLGIKENIFGKFYE